MNLPTFLLVLLSAFAWSLFDISRKKTGTLLSPPVALLLYMIFSLPIFVVWAAFGGTIVIAPEYWLMGALGILVNFLANWCFIESVSRSPISSSVPMLAFIPVFSTIFSFLFLGEVLRTEQVIGVVVVVIGSLLLNGLPKFSGEHLGSWLMFCVALLWSVVLVIDKTCLKSAAVPVHAGIQTIGVILCTFILLRFKGVKIDFTAAISRGGWYFWLGVIACFGATALQLIVLPMADIGIVEAVKRAANMVLSFMWGYGLFREHISKQKLVAMGILLLGTFLVLQVV